MIKLSLIAINVLVVVVLIWSLINYTLLNNEVGRIVQVWGIIAAILIIIILEGAPVAIGPSVVIVSLLAMKEFNWWFVLLIFLGSAIIGNIIYFYLGVYSGKKILKYFDKKDINKYKKIFNKNGRLTMITMAISPVPYLPTVAGVFRMSKFRMFVEVMGARMLRHLVIFFFWIIVLGIF